MAERKFKDSFLEAGAGIWYCVVSQRNMRIHLLVAAIVLIASWFLGLTPLEFALVVFAITMVLVVEMFNTAVEKTIDLYVKTFHPGARLAKHVAAGAVFTAAINSVIIGVIVFGPHLYSLLFR